MQIGGGLGGRRTGAAHFGAAPYYGMMAEPATGIDYAETGRRIREIVETVIATYEPTR